MGAECSKDHDTASSAGQRAFGMWWIYYFASAMGWAILVSFLGIPINDATLFFHMVVIFGTPSYLSYRDYHTHKPCFEQKRKEERRRRKEKRKAKRERERKKREREQKRREKRKRRQATIEDLYALSPREFEYLVAEVMKSTGYDAHTTSQSGDLGADVVATKGDGKVVVEAKRQQKPVGPSVVQRAIGARHAHDADRAMVVSLGGFTPSAQEAAEGAPVSLWGPEELAGEVTEQDIHAAQNTR